MLESLIQEVEAKYPGKIFLTMDEVAKLLECPRDVVYNWTRRLDPNKRPPQIQAGKFIRFPKRTLIEWLVKEGI